MSIDLFDVAVRLLIVLVCIAGAVWGFATVSALSASRRSDAVFGDGE